MDNVKIEYWMGSDEISHQDFSDYWNDEDKEVAKDWYVLDGDFEKMEKYLAKTGLVEDLHACISLLKDKYNATITGNGIDIAAGVCWSAQYIFKNDVETMYFLDYSKHRLLKIAPSVLEHYNIPLDKLSLALGSFYDIHLPDDSLDFVFMSQAFHHAKHPQKLLDEVQRVLKNGKPIIMIGEHRVDTETAPPPDKTLGDHYYTLSDYDTIFKERFQYHLIDRGGMFRGFALINEKA